jgi:hypothetical protein
MTMIQQEIRFFYPLTEQIPLDLIYEETKPIRYTMDAIGTGSGFYLASNGTSSSFITGQLTIDCDRVRFQSKKKRTFIQKLMYKAMGIKVYESNSN